MSETTAKELRTNWRFFARHDQLEPPGDWFIWLLQCGRGAGKTRTGAEFIRERIDDGRARVANIAGPTWTDVWDTMVEGTEQAPGLMRIWPQDRVPIVHRSDMNPHLKCWNGAVIRLRSAQRAERFRGIQGDVGWCDEADAWKPDGMSPADAFGNFEMGIRLGDDPRIVCTSTPKPAAIIKTLLARDDVFVTRASMHDNPYLAATFVAAMERVYGGTRFGRQEIEGELLGSVDGAIVTLELIEQARRRAAPVIETKAIGVDPAVTSGENSDEWGIVLGGIGDDQDFYLLEDRSEVLAPSRAARRIVDLYHDTGSDFVVVEVNQGGDMIEEIIRQQPGGDSVKVVQVRATRGKHVRAMPCLAIYEQGRAHHVGNFDEIEDEVTQYSMTGYEGIGSPNRSDALFWAMTELMVGPQAEWADFYGPGAIHGPRDDEESDEEPEDDDGASEWL